MIIIPDEGRLRNCAIPVLGWWFGDFSKQVKSSILRTVHVEQSQLLGPKDEGTACVEKAPAGTSLAYMWRDPGVGFYVLL